MVVATSLILRGPWQCALVTPHQWMEYSFFLCAALWSRWSLECIRSSGISESRPSEDQKHLLGPLGKLTLGRLFLRTQLPCWEKLKPPGYGPPGDTPRRTQSELTASRQHHLDILGRNTFPSGPGRPQDSSICSDYTQARPQVRTFPAEPSQPTEPWEKADAWLFWATEFGGILLDSHVKLSIHLQEAALGVSRW